MLEVILKIHFYWNDKLINVACLLAQLNTISKLSKDHINTIYFYNMYSGFIIFISLFKLSESTYFYRRSSFYLIYIIFDWFYWITGFLNTHKIYRLLLYTTFIYKTYFYRRASPFYGAILNGVFRWGGITIIIFVFNLLNKFCILQACTY